jgi:peptidoglycan hydrolase-like protein with peptidoglycan-binding domain
MQQTQRRILPRAAWSLALSLFAASTLAAQNRLTLPAGSVILVRTNSSLESSTLTQGQTFETTVADSVGIDDYAVIPSGSRIRGVVSYVQPATRQQSGVVEVAFNQLTLPNGSSYPIVGRLTSTDPTERRQIESSADQRVVLVGGRGGIGAAIAGAGSTRSSSSGILGALGQLLSEGRNVSVPAGTALAVKLDQAVTLRGLGRYRGNSAIVTSTDLIRAAQQALAQQNYYRGSITGQLDYATQRALFQFQADRGISATGNLDIQTANLLGITTNLGGSVIGGTTSGRVLSPAQASELRRSATNLLTRERLDLGLTSLGRLDNRRNYSDSDIELWFAVSAFNDNAALYEQLARVSGNTSGTAYANAALVNAARRVDSALQSATTSSTFRNAWAQIRAQINYVDSNYR